MTGAVWLACHSEAPLVEGQVGASLRMIEAALPERLAGMRRTEFVGRHILLAVWRPASGPGSATTAPPDGGERALHEGYPVGADRLGVPDADALAVAVRLQADPSLIRHMLPPYGSVALLSDGLRIQNDCLGFAKIYEAAAPGAPGLRVWSNASFAASLFAFDRAERSEPGWVLFMASDRFLFDTTPLRGVSLLPPSVVIEAADRATGVTVHREDIVRVAFGAEPPATPAALAERIEDALGDVHRSIVGLDLGPVVIPLSGGRDSRLLAATALRHGRADAFYTSDPPDLDVVIAEQLVRQLQPPVPWTRYSYTDEARRHSVATGTATLSSADAWRRLAGYEVWADGDGDVTPYALAPDRQANPGVQISGVGGELTRAFLYRADGLRHPSRTTSAYWNGVERVPGFVDLGAARQYLWPRLRALRGELDDAGISGLRQLDYWYLFGRTRHMKASRPDMLGIRPYLALACLTATLPLTPQQRVATTLHRDLVRLLVPAWADVPFTHDLASAEPVRSTAQPLGELFWQDRLVRDLGAELGPRLRADPLLDGRGIDALVNTHWVTGQPAVATMRLFNRLLHVAAFAEAVASVNTRAADARRADVAGAAVVTPSTRLGIPDAPVSATSGSIGVGVAMSGLLLLRRSDRLARHRLPAVFRLGRGVRRRVRRMLGS